MSSENLNTAAQQEKVPSRTIGMTIMVTLILFTAFWMSRPQTGSSDSSDALIYQETANQETAGFRSDAWQLPNSNMLGFVKIPAGEFTMGSNPALDRMAYDTERWSLMRRQGSVDLPDYYIGKYEVTVAQISSWAAQNSNLARGISLDGDGVYPVTQITWPQAVAYANWLDQQLRNYDETPGEIAQLLANGGRVTLPSEAEWEKAARGTDGRIFPWGFRPQAGMANYSSGSALAVGSSNCPQCAYGLSDMAGNVWEFTRSPMQEYPYDASDDFAVTSPDTLWVMRGGSYSDEVNNVRTAIRGGVDASVRSSNIGFRLVISSL